MAIVTLGADGAIIVEHHGQLVHAVQAFSVDSVDVTGAGDVLCGAFVTEFLRTGSAISSGSYACAAAALATRSSGGPSVNRMPSDHMVRALMSTAS